MTKTVLITNYPAPYREKVYEKVGSENINFQVIYIDHLEKGRKWLFELGNYKKVFLIEESANRRFFEIKIWNILNKLNPDVVITTGFSSVHLIAIFWIKYYHKKHICFTDGWKYTVSKLTIVHKLLRKLIYRRSDAFIGPSIKTLKMFESYGAIKQQLFQSHLCVDNQRFINCPQLDKKYDLMFSGQFVERKMPFFFVDVCKEILKKYKTLKVLILGEGKLKSEIIDSLKYWNIDFYYPGFVQQQDLPKYYKQSKIFLFPTKSDPWGVVANEACAAGLPIITTPYSGVADEIVIHNYNGYVIDADIKKWGQYIDNLLSDELLYNKFATNSLKLISSFNDLNASKGIKDAIKYVSINTSINFK